jgi:hypothetical protein
MSRFTGSAAEWATALVATAALLTTLPTLYYAKKSADAAVEASVAATTATNTAVDQRDREFASFVEMDEAPEQYQDGAFSAEGPVRIWTIVNGSKNRIENVWVETTTAGNYTRSRPILIEGLPRCMTYRFEPGIFPAVIHFTDSHGSWRRAFGSRPEREPAPTPETLPPREWPKVATAIHEPPLGCSN